MSLKTSCFSKTAVRILWYSGTNLQTQAYFFWFVFLREDLLWIIGRCWIASQWLFDKNTNQNWVTERSFKQIMIHHYNLLKNTLQEKSKLTLRTLPSACATWIVPHLLPNQQIDLLERKKWPENQHSQIMLDASQGTTRSLAHLFGKWVSCFAARPNQDKMLSKGRKILHSHSTKNTRCFRLNEKQE